MDSLHTIDLAIILFYVVGVIVAGLILSRRAGEGIESYFLGGRQLPWYLLGVSNASGMFDITGTMWTVGILFVFGVKSIFFPWIWPTFNQIFLMVYLAAWMRRSHVLTGAEWLATRFSRGAGLEASHIATVLFAVISVVGMVAYAFTGIGKFAVVFLPWELSENTYALIILGVTTLYVTAGGMYGVVVTDVVQFVLMTIVSIWIGLIAMGRVSRDQINAVIPEGWDSLTSGPQMELDWVGQLALVQSQFEEKQLYQAFFAFMMVAILGGILKSMAGPTPGYDMQRILACRSSREASLMSGLVTPILMLPRYFMVAGITVLALVNFNEGLLAEGAQQIDFEKVLPFVIREFMPVGLVGLVVAGLLAAFMSTFDSTVNSGAAYLVNDVYKRYFESHSTPRREIVMSYACSIGVVVLGMVLGFRLASIDNILQWVTAGLGSAYLAPNLLKWYWWRLNGLGYFTGMISGTVMALLQTSLLDTKFQFLPSEPLYAFPAILGISLFLTIAVSLLTKPDDDETLKAFYRSVRPWGWWGPIREKCQLDDPQLEPNRGWGRDACNCLVGTIWQTAIVALPIFVVIRHPTSTWMTLGVVVITSVILKFNWLDRLEPAAAD